MKNQKILILDFGGQYNQLIARRVRECNVYCEVKPFSTSLEEIKAFAPIGIIFTGGPNSVYEAGSPHVDTGVYSLGVPILGICYGCQLLAHELGGKVTAAQDDSAREYGKTETYFDTSCKLFKNIPAESITWMSHGDYMAQVPQGFRLVYDYLKEHTAHASLSDLAARIGYSSDHLGRRIREKTGRSFSDVAAEYRTHAAAELLSTTDIPVESIALTLGYSSPSGLYKGFVRHFGMTPARYRRASRSPRA